MNQPQATPKTNQTPGVMAPVDPALSANPLTSAGSGPSPQMLPEKDLWAGRMHWQNAIGRAAFWFVLNVVFVVVAYYLPRNSWLTSSRILWSLAGLFFVSTIFMLGAIVIRIFSMRYRITNQRIFIEKGLLSRTMDQTELIRVDDVRMQQSFVNRIFNIGTVVMMTSDVTDRDVPIVGIKDPVRVTEIIRQQMRTLRGKTVFIENV